MRKPNVLARALRRNMPEAERRLWVRIRNKRLDGLRFRRQHSIGPYIADFVCLEAKLVVELDGDQHGRGDAPERDAARDCFIECEGFVVLRFWNAEIVRKIDDVLSHIQMIALERIRELEIAGRNEGANGD